MTSFRTWTLLRSANLLLYLLLLRHSAGEPGPILSVVQAAVGAYVFLNVAAASLRREAPAGTARLAP